MNEIPSSGEVFRGEDGTVSTILPSNYGQDYEASEGELEEYAEYIGIDSAKEPELMWIAKEGLRAALPDGWRACQTDENEVYYFNFQTGESLWDHPMDEHFKAQVVSERAKRGGGGSSVGAAAGGPLHADRTAAGTGSTKAIADSFFSKPSAAISSNRAPGSLADIGGGGVAAATTGTATAKDSRTPGSSMKDGASAPRAPPDVSDILALSSATSHFPSLGASRATANAGLSRMKEREAALRKRLEEGNEAQLRALRIELDKKAGAERQRLTEARAKLQKDLDAAWEQERSCAAGDTVAASSVASAATQRRLQIAREVKQIEESWKARLHDVGARVRELQQQVEEKQQTLLKAFQQSPEELRKMLEARNAAEVAQLREAKKKENDIALVHLKSEQASALAEARLRANDAVATAAKATEAEFEQKVQERRVRNGAMLASLKAVVETKQADLAAKEKASAAASSATTPSTTAAAAAAGASSGAEEAALAAAQAAADAEVVKAREASAAAVARLREEYAAKKREKEASLKAAQPPPLSRSSLTSSAISSPTVGLSSPADSFSARGIGAAEQAKLDEEDQKLRDEADRAARIFEEETQIMVENKKAGRPLTAAPSADVAASVSAEAIAALGRTANQEQRAREAENTRHFMVMKQLEAKHDQAVRALKAQLDKNLASPTSSSAPRVFNPHQQPSFVTQLAARKREWLRDHPAPSAEMPTLLPVPTLPGATLQSDVAAVRMPDEEELAKLIKTRLAQVREEAQRQYDQEAQALQATRQADLEAWRETYRSSRLVEVEKAMTALKEAAAAAGASAGEGRRLEKLQSELQALEAAIKAADSEHERQTRALEESIAGLEASLAQLRTQERREEEARAEQLHFQQRRLLPKGEHKSPSSAHAAAALPSRTSVPASSEAHISEEEAADEAAALRARWTALIKALRAAVQREMEAYQRALDESAAQHHTTSAAGAVGAHPAGTAAAVVAANAGAPIHTVSTPRDRDPAACATSFLPPPAPSAMLTGSALPGRPAALQEQKPPQPTSSLPAIGITTANPSGYTTPLQRHPREHDDSGAGSTILGGAATRMSSSSPAPQLCLMDSRLGAVSAHGDLPVQRPLHSSSLQPQSQPHRLWPDASVAPSSDAPMGVRSCHLDPHRNTSVSSAAAPWTTVLGDAQGGGPLTCTSAASAQQVTEAPVDRSSYSGGPASGSASVDADGARARHHAARLAALQQTVRARRRDLQARRREMEALRDEWRADMRACKQQGDRMLACQLREVKTELEVRARELNEEVLQLKKMHETVHEEVRQFRRWLDVRQQPEGQMERGGGDSVSSSAAWGGLAFTGSKLAYVCRGEGDRSPASSSEKTADVMGLLHNMVDRTERLEELLLMSRLETHSPSTHHSGMRHSGR
ncbi:conserved hypothetical protein [Leishmania major strain Friedlin]|uniref:WW domain-containing protein n=1 Tax=Leishmania major TaxID=5664 RepID=Q4QE77_LEIMA|nr:conserved hypothetical protein [Leishmania major strain Friedlin]CAG9572347.1 WW_domain_containing_protein_-_putative [Leishmania major strain Friedlin]CAJ03863.1 conserved hypothetical protein [Leishmania major strain Friedlin]|eukprot:XP_001682371.1 conserved hypothetical protein [Leishmania major strain Friedlin]